MPALTIPSTRHALLLSRPGPLQVVRRRDQLDVVNSRRLSTAVRAKEWVVVAPGAFARTREWHALTPIERHRARVLEMARRLQVPAVLSHFAAAALWGVDILGDWPARIDVAYPVSSGGRSGGWIRRHTTGTDDIDVVSFGRHAVTTPAQTALDLARLLPFTRGVTVVDQALSRAREGGPLTDRNSVLELARSSARHRGDVRARRVIDFASDLAANVRESQSRVLIMQLGFPTPRLQERRMLPSGRVAYGDFYFPVHDHWGELDGRGKYRSPELMGDRDPVDVVIDEKNRENEIRRTVAGFSRWEPADLDEPGRLYDILTRDGLPSVLPRP